MPAGGCTGADGDRRGQPGPPVRSGEQAAPVHRRLRQCKAGRRAGQSGVWGVGGRAGRVAAVVPRAGTVPGAAALSVAGGCAAPGLPCWDGGLPDSFLPGFAWRRRPLRATFETGKCGVVVALPLRMPPHTPPVYPLNVPNVFARAPQFTHFA